MAKTLDRILNAGKRFALGLAAVATIASCGDKTVNVDGGIDVGLKDYGTIYGKVTIPLIENNQVVYTGHTGEGVRIKDTDFKTITIAGGNYSITNIPSGAYEVQGGLMIPGSAHLWGYTSSSQPVMVFKQESSQVPDIQLTPNSMSDKNIVRGTARWNNGSPYAGEVLCVYNVAWGQDGKPKPASKEDSTITSSDGSFALYFDLEPHYLISRKGVSKFTEAPSSNTGYFSFSENGILTKAITVTPK